MSPHSSHIRGSDPLRRDDVTSREEKADLIQAVAAGIDDCAWPPIDGDRFGARLVMAEERLRRRSKGTFPVAKNEAL